MTKVIGRPPKVAMPDILRPMLPMPEGVLAQHNVLGSTDCKLLISIDSMVQPNGPKFGYVLPAALIILLGL